MVLQQSLSPSVPGSGPVILMPRDRQSESGGRRLRLS
jgi:hypothetical protein